MARPALVVLDEPTSGLDPLMQEVVAETLRAYARDGGTVFFSSHVLAEVEQVCDRVAMLRAGRVEDVFALEAERRLAEHVVVAEFAAAPLADAFDGLGGVTLQRVDGLTYTYHVSNGFDALIKRFAWYEVVDLTSRESSLEELFLARYGNGGSGAERG